MHGKSCYLTSTLALFSPTSKVSKFCLELEEVPKPPYLSPIKKKKRPELPLWRNGTSGVLGATGMRVQTPPAQWIRDPALLQLQLRSQL